jgi:hypothetical protein
VCKGFEHRFNDIDLQQKPSIVGGVSGTISAKDFDYERLASGLLKLPFFSKKPVFEKDKVCLEWTDGDDDFRSEIEIRRDGSFGIEVIIGVDFSEIKGSFLDDLESIETKKWYRIARSLVQTIVFYIERTAHKQWRDAKIAVPFEADAYPLNIYARSKMQ